MVNSFRERVDAILEDIPVTQTFFMLKYELNDYHPSFSKNHGSPTHVTRLKVVPNMANPISLNENLP